MTYLMLIYKNKGNIINVEIRVKKLMSHTMKVWNKVIEKRLQVEKICQKNTSDLY